MSQTAKDRKAEKRRQAKTQQFAAVNLAAKVGQVNPLAAHGDLDHASTWPGDFSDMARRIETEGFNSVPNRDRDLVQKRTPTGTFTRRDGKSVWDPSVFRSGECLMPDANIKLATWAPARCYGR